VESPPTADGEPTDTPDPYATLTKNASPFAYKVDGQERTFDGIVVGKNGAGYIAPDQLDRIRNTFGLADKSIADNRGLYERVQSFERLGGVSKIATLEEQVAQLDAAGTKLLELLRDPTSMLMLDEQGNVVPNQRAITEYTERLQFVSEKAAFEARGRFQQNTQQVQQTATQGQQHEKAFHAVFDQFRQQYPTLTEGDIASAKAHFGAFTGALFRQATPDDAQRYGYRIGEWLIDTPKMAPWFEDRMALRASTAAHDTARKKAEQDNRTRQPAPVVSPRKAAHEQPRNKDGTYAEKQAERERVKREMARAHKRGEFYSESKSNDV
jgi:hypothetical protein